MSVNEVFLLVGFTVTVVSYRGKNTPQGAINILVAMKLFCYCWRNGQFLNVLF